MRRPSRPSGARRSRRRHQAHPPQPRPARRRAGRGQLRARRARPRRSLWSAGCSTAAWTTSWPGRPTPSSMASTGACTTSACPTWRPRAMARSAPWSSFAASKTPGAVRAQPWRCAPTSRSKIRSPRAGRPGSTASWSPRRPPPWPRPASGRRWRRRWTSGPATSSRAASPSDGRTRSSSPRA